MTTKKMFFFTILAFIVACSGSKVKYETYHNQFYNYTVEYPDFLIPQGEATNQDGQSFISEDQTIQLLVYRDYKNDYLTGGDLYTIGEAYREELKMAEGVFNKKLEANSYFIEYKIDDVLHATYSMLSGDNYFNIRFEYPEKEKKMMKSVIDYVVNSLKVKASDGNGALVRNASTDAFEDVFVEDFLNDCYWNKNFNNLLRKKDPILATYIDSKMDVQRYYAPGTVSKLASRSEDFGFVSEDDFLSKPRKNGSVKFELMAVNEGPCGLDFRTKNIVYYQSLQKVPDVVVNTETFETKPVKVIYPKAEIMALYVPNAYDNPRGFYFINTPDGWKLAFVDDSLCEA
ncbi:MAG: hypothetical protein PHR79_07475 [Bacteroidales bacterium]|nr:hypothetical protein [Bacteroidales bacterium]